MIRQTSSPPNIFIKIKPVMKKLNAGEKELVADYFLYLEDLRKGYLTCPQSTFKINLVMNTNKTLLAIYEEVEVIKQRTERFYDFSPNKPCPSDLQHVLQKLEEISKFLQPN
jgi:hypothetical protein